MKNFKSNNPDSLIAEFTNLVWVGRVEAALEDLSRLEGIRSWHRLHAEATQYALNLNKIDDFAQFFNVTDASEWYDVFETIQRIVDWKELQQAAKDYYENSN